MMFDPKSTASFQYSSSTQADVDSMEWQLQQELRSMFDVDTQQYLQNYMDLVLRLQTSSWTQDIQELFRNIHTIKGGAVTVSADGILYVATVLEDLLGDLRHLQPAPPLEDGQLQQMLLEAGELLASSLTVQELEAAAQVAVQPTVERIQTLRTHIKQTYFPEWTEQKRLHQEFAEQGFDLVVLNLEMTLEQLPLQGSIPQEALAVARQTLEQLVEIGGDLELAEGWILLLQNCEALFASPSAQIWRSHWPLYLKTLKTSAHEGGIAIDLPEFPDLGTSEIDLLSYSSERDESSLSLLEPIAADNNLDFDLDTFEQVSEGLDDFDFMSDNLDNFEVNPISEDLDNFELEIALGDLGDFDLDLAPEGLDNFELNLGELDFQTVPDGEAPTENILESTDEWLDLVALPAEEEQVEAIAPAISPEETVVQRNRTEYSDIQIPIPLGRLDRTAQHLIDSLLTARATQSLNRTLQGQLTQLLTLAKESTQYIGRLRQLQDDYALLDSLKTSNDSESGGIPLERYRQGYSTINRLLENSLRLSELGLEAEKKFVQTTDNLHKLERQMTQLQQTVEQSRLVPFSKVAFRVRAILRDLIARFGKPSQLDIQGENLELDAGTISKLEPMLLHLIRNAYDHGIESPEERVAQSKPEQGQLTLCLKRRGNTFVLDLKDDGRGIDAMTIQEIAQRKGLPLSQIQTPADLLAVICQPGFSSQTVVTDVSGRGMGMDVVVEQIASLGGSLSLETVLGQGTTFRLQFPVPHLLVPCVLFQSGDRTFALPTADIATTNILANLSATPVEDPNVRHTWEIQQGEEIERGIDFLDYWGSETTPRRLDETAIGCAIQSPEGSFKVWVLADELLEQTELLIMPLPAPLVAPIGLLGLSLQPDGSLIPVLEATALAERLLQNSMPALEPEAIQPTAIDDEISSTSMPGRSAKLNQTILVVDDAALMRRRMEASLTASGYIVHTCNDGLEAWNWLKTHPMPALVITDIEMPNMDGFTLISQCRQAEIDIPILVVSSRLAEEWQKEARRLGATDYLTKGFSTADLVNTVQTLME